MTRTRCFIVSTCVIALLLLITPQLFAQNQQCLQDAYNTFNGTHKNMSCTANDVSTAAVQQGSVNVFSGGIPGTNSCIAGGQFSFTAVFEIKTTSSSARSNIGIFFGSGNNALTGSCTNAILTPPHSCANGTATCGDVGSPGATYGGYEELDGSINQETAPFGCGDTASSDSSVQFGAGTQAARLEVDGVTCPTTASACPASSGLTGTCLALPTCTGWYQPTAGIPVCNSPTGSWVPTAVPGTSSKCECGIVYVPVTPISPQVTVAKGCDLGSDTTPHNSCHAGPEGQPVTYTVTVTNTTPAGEGGIVVSQICDSQYGQIFPASGTCPAVAAGAPGHSYVTGTTCTASNPGTVANGSSGSCTFTVNHGENLTVQDTATVYGYSQLQPTANITPTGSNSVTVDSTDAPTTAITNAGQQPGFPNACVTLRLSATVANTSAADENLTLDQVSSFGNAGYIPALMDNTSFGDITRIHGNANTSGSVTGYTCGVAAGSAGQGTLSTLTVGSGVGQAPGGAFPQQLAFGTCAFGDPSCPPTNNGGSYTCWFDGVVCGTPTALTGTTCSYGLSANVSIGANLTGDDPAPNADSITQTPTPFTARVCLTQP